MYTVCIQSNGRGSMKEFAVSGHPELLLQYDRETDPTYPWAFAKVENGRLVSGFCTAFTTKKDALSALENGEKIFGK